MVKGCPFCWPMEREEILLESEWNAFIATPEEVLLGSGMIVPKAHRETVFDMTEEEFRDTYLLLQRVKAYIDERYAPDGYNVGWNCQKAGGQTVFHAHLHVIPRYKDEPMAGLGIRHHLKQPENKRSRRE